MKETELTVEQAADLLSVHKNTVRRYIHTGLLPAKIYPPRHYRVVKKDVEALKIGQKYAPRKIK